jgi:membrane protein DedA with SNARE-associated domain
VAVVLGGVIVSSGGASLPVMIAVVAVAAIAGDSVGYELGRRLGPRLTRSPRFTHRFGPKLEATQRYVRERGGRAVFLGRWTSVLRALVPAVAGMSRMPYGRYLVYNVAGGVAWAGVFVTAGYLAGASWQQVERIAGQASLVLLLLIVLALLLRWATRRLATRTDEVQRRLASVADWGPVAAVRSRFGDQLQWIGARLTPRAARGLGWTMSAVGVLAAGWLLGAIVQDLLARDELVLLDAPVAAWFADHRTIEVAAAADAITRGLSPGWGWVPVIGVAGLLAWRTRSWGDGARVVLAATATAVTVIVLHRLLPVIATLRFPSAATAFTAATVVALLPVVARWGWQRAIQAAGVGASFVVLAGIADLTTGRSALSGVIGGATLGTLLAVLFEFTGRTVGAVDAAPVTSRTAP